MRLIIKIGDVFEVKMADGMKFIQYIANDLSMLNSSVIRAFKKLYPVGSTFSIDEIVEGEVEFHAHVFLRNGCKQGCWTKIGHSLQIGRLDMLFRNSEDYGNPKITTSVNWYVWKINEPFLDVGRLTPEYQKAEIGVVIPPDIIVHRMQTGKYDFVYPKYE